MAVWAFLLATPYFTACAPKKQSRSVVLRFPDLFYFYY
jgi:hypothetical protein